jgi:type I restriction enzyme M protein
MLTGELRSQVDRLWDSFWTGGISNPLKVVEQITYLLFLKRLDELQTLEENKSQRLGKPIEREIFPAGKDARGCNYADMRWSRLKNQSPDRMFTIVSDHVFPFLREMGGTNGTYSKLMADARFEIPKAALLSNIVDLLDQIPMEDRDTKGDLYEYMLGKIASAGQNGQFRTPRHIIKLMVEMVEPTAKDTICDPASGTCGFLVVAGEYLRDNKPELFADARSREHFHNGMFNGYDFDTTMLRIGSMNMLLHGVENADIQYRDSLSQDYAVEDEKYSLILANPPFAGNLDFAGTAKDLLSVVSTKKTEVLFIALFLKLLKPGGRAAVIVPDGVVANKTQAYREIRKLLVEEHLLEAVISMPSGIFRPYSDVTTSILFFTKTNSGGTENVWFYDLDADGFGLDDKRLPLLSYDKLGARPAVELNENEFLSNNLPDLLNRWKKRYTTEKLNSKSDKSFTVSKKEIVSTNYDLSIGQYKQVAIVPKVRVTSSKIEDLNKKNKFGIEWSGFNNLCESLEKIKLQSKKYSIGSVIKRPSLLDKNIDKKVWSLALENIEPHTGKLIDEVLIDKVELGTSTFYFEPPVVLYSKLRPYLNKVIVPAKSGYATTELVPIYCDERKILPLYLSYILRSQAFVNFAEISSGGAKMPRVKMDKFWNYLIPVPELKTQEEVLFLLNELEVQIKSQIDRAQIMQRSIFSFQQRMHEGI